MRAADHRNESNAWHDSHSIRERACGSIFANTVIKSLTSINGVAMQPADPNDDQVATFNAYTRSIVDICKHGRTGIPLGIPLGYFKDRWNQLVDVPYAGDSTTKLNLDPHPSNTGETVTALPGPTAGVLRSADLKRAMARAMIAGDIHTMAKLFVETCPGDWHRGWNVGLRSMLEDAIEHGIEPEKRSIRLKVDIEEFINYRWHLAEIADCFVREYKLRKPNDEICILWNDFEWSAPTIKTVPGYSDRFNLVHAHLVNKNFNPKPIRSQGPPFARFTRYMAAAVALTDLSQEENDRALEGLVSDMDDYKEVYQRMCDEDKGVLQKKREWHKAIGR